jgi:fatty acyl-CoA reductase
MNIRGVKKMIDLARKMKKLDVFIHVSTAYANCDRQHIGETVYNQLLTPDKLLEACDWMDDDTINLLTPKMLNLRPNTYTFTKAIAESLVLQYGDEIPITIARPSIVCATWREPFPGWIDNLNGPTGLFVAVAKGLLKSMMANTQAIADILPVDTCVNFLIASGWYRGTGKTAETIVFNCTTGMTNPLRWATFETALNKIIRECPYENVFLYPYGEFTSSKFVKIFWTFIVQTIPSFIFDLLLRITNKKPL